MKKQGQNAETEEPATSFLPQALGNLFDKECLQQDENRSGSTNPTDPRHQKQKLPILKDWETPLKWSLEGCSEEAQHEGKCWLEREQKPSWGKRKSIFRTNLPRRRPTLMLNRKRLPL